MSLLTGDIFVLNESNVIREKVSGNLIFLTNICISKNNKFYGTERRESTAKTKGENLGKVREKGINQIH